MYVKLWGKESFEHNFERHLAVIPEKVCSTYKGFVCVSVCECVTPVVCRDHVNTGLVRLRCGGGG